MSQVRASRLSPPLILMYSALLCALIPGVASAQTLAEEARQERFKAYVTEAKSLYDQEDYLGAIKRLQRAHMLIPDERVLVNIAASYEKADDCVSAMAYYDAALRVPNISSASKTRSQKALKAGAKSCPAYKPDQLAGRVTISAFPKDARITIDDEPMGEAPLEIIALPVGRHRFEISAPGHETLEETVVLGSRADIALDYKLKVEVVEEPDPDPDTDIIIPDVTDPEVDGEKRGPNIPAIALIGVGAVGLGAGAYLNWFRLCPETCYYDEERSRYERSSPEYAQLSEERTARARQMAIITTVGGLMVAGGAAWIIVDTLGSKSESSTVDDLVLIPLISPESAGMGVMRRF